MPTTEDAFEVPVAELVPTQYCLSARKLREVLSWFEPDDPDMEPVSVARAGDDEWLLLDGHTRAFCAVLAGETAVAAVDETDDVALDVYLTCRDWCRERGVESVQDLAGELWSAARYEDEWIGHCDDAFADE